MRVKYCCIMGVCADRSPVAGGRGEGDLGVGSVMEPGMLGERGRAPEGAGERFFIRAWHCASRSFQLFQGGSFRGCPEPALPANCLHWHATGNTNAALPRSSDLYPRQGRAALARAAPGNGVGAATVLAAIGPEFLLGPNRDGVKQTFSTGLALPAWTAGRSRSSRSRSMPRLRTCIRHWRRKAMDGF